MPDDELKRGDEARDALENGGPLDRAIAAAVRAFDDVVRGELGEGQPRAIIVSATVRDEDPNNATAIAAAAIDGYDERSLFVGLGQQAMRTAVEGAGGHMSVTVIRPQDN